MSWEVASAIIGAVALVLEWLRALGADHRVWQKIDEIDARVRVMEAKP